MSVFDDYKAEDFAKPLRALESSVEGKSAQSALLFLRGDHWQNPYLIWKGPRPPIGHPAPALFYETIRKDFVSKNIVGEVSRRDRNGVIGREPNWSVTVSRTLKEGETPTPDEQTIIDEAKSALDSWWSVRKNGRKVVLSTLQQVVDELNASGRGLLRFFIPPAFLDDDGTLKANKNPNGDLKKAFNLLYLKKAEYKGAMVITDEDSQEQAGVFVSQKNGKTIVEAVYLSDDGETVLKVFENDKEIGAERYDLASRLTIYELNRDALISQQVMDMQCLFNCSATMRTRTLGQAGFPQTTVLNGKEPSHLEDDPDNPGQQIEVKDPFRTGTGIVNFIKGEALYDDDGKIKGYAGASIDYRDPVNVDTFDKTEFSAYKNILSETNQTYALISSDATSSGESRIQARADFVMSLRETKTHVDAAGQWVLETALAWAADLAGLGDRYAGLKINFDSRLDAGPLSAAEREIIAKEVKDGLRSKEDAMMMLGIDDPAAMKSKILEEQAEFNPIQSVQVERAKLALQNDQLQGDGGIGNRIEEAAKTAPEPIN